MSIVTELPLWWILFCALLGIAFAFLFYRRDSRLDEARKAWVWALAISRFLSVFIIAFLLLGPMFRSFSQSIERPILVFAQDNSESILADATDSAAFAQQYREQLQPLLDRLAERYDLVQYSFGSQVEKDGAWDFADIQTDYSMMLEEVESNYTGRNLGAVVIAGDGIYNEGTHPRYMAERMAVPIYALALGDTSSEADLVLSDVRANEIAFLGNEFPIQITVDAYLLQGQKSRLTIHNNGKQLFEQEIDIQSSSFSRLINASIMAEKAGLQRYVITVSAVEGEANLRNNSRQIALEVIDNKQKILLLGRAPHPDLGALRGALAQNPNYDVEVRMVDDFDGRVAGFNLVVLHDLPNRGGNQRGLLEELEKQEVATLFIVGASTDLAGLNALGSGLQITARGSRGDQAQPIFNPLFKLFTSEDELPRKIEDFPPLLVPFADISVSATANVLFTQRISSIATPKPLIALNPSNDAASRKLGFILGEGIWRWRLFDYRQNGDQEIFNELVNNIAQYLALRVEKENFVVKVKKIFKENEPVYLEAEVYNESFQAIDYAKVSFQIVDSLGRKYDFGLMPQDNGGGYLLNAGVFPVGDYSFTANAEADGNTYQRSGAFSVLPVNYESVNTVADHQLLYGLAKSTGGQMFLLDQLDQLEKALAENPEIVPISYTEKKLEEVLNHKWIFALLIMLLAFEWFARKYLGTV